MIERYFLSNRDAIASSKALVSRLFPPGVLGICLVDDQWNWNGSNAIVQEIKSKTAGLDPEEKAKVIFAIGGIDGAKTVLALAEDDPDVTRLFIEELRVVNG